MNDVESDLALNYKEQINEACKALPNGMSNFVMHIMFNDLSTFVLSNDYSIINPYYKEVLYKEFVTLSNEVMHRDHYLFDDNNSESSVLKKWVGVRPIYNIIRSHSECTFVFSAIGENSQECSQIFYDKTVKKFESFCIKFIDKFIDLIVSRNPAYRFSFVLNSKLLREAIIRQGYEQEITLSTREQECLWYAGQGKSSKEIAQLLRLSPYTVEGYLKHIREVFNCNKLPEIMMECIHRGIIGKVSLFNKKQSFDSVRHQQSPIKNMHFA